MNLWQRFKAWWASVDIEHDSALSQYEDLYEHRKFDESVGG